MFSQILSRAWRYRTDSACVMTLVTTRLHANKRHAFISRCTSTSQIRQVNNGFCVWQHFFTCTYIWYIPTNTTRCQRNGSNSKCFVVSAFLIRFYIFHVPIEKGKERCYYVLSYFSNAHVSRSIPFLNLFYSCKCHVCIIFPVNYLLLLLFSTIQI